MSNKKSFDIDLSPELNDSNYNYENDINFSSMNIKDKKNKIKLYKNRIKNIFYLLIIFLLLFMSVYSLGLYFQSKYKNLQLNIINQFLLDNIGKQIGFYIENYIWQQDTDNLDIDFKDIISGNKKDFVNKIDIYLMNQKVDYFTKLSTMKSFIERLDRDLEKENNILQKLEKDFRSYAFLPKEIADILDESDIQGIILTINSIKLYLIATQWMESDKLFRNIAYLVGSSNIYSLKNIVKYWLSKGEFLVRKFLEIYLISTNKRLAKADFEKYVSFYVDSDEKNLYRFKIGKYFSYLEAVYRKMNTDIAPSIVINFNSFDPKKKEISFVLEINTDLNQKDKDRNADTNTENLYEYHIDKIVKFLNMIRGSHLIIGENIDIKKLKVDIKKDKYSPNKKYLSTSLSFKVKLQPSVQREIFDFIYKR